ncbi:MAG: DUF1080 domain-containing protein [Verrucomicrobiia bacterium]
MKNTSTAALVATGALTVLLLAGCATAGRSSGANQELFNGKDLRGWTFVSGDPQARAESTWSVQNGILRCTGEPIGFLQSERQFGNFRMVVEYRWAPGQKPGNSGIFSRINGVPRALPRCVEVQLQHGNAGDILGLQGMGMAAGQDRFFEVKAHPLAGDIRGVKKIAAAEKEPGKWNRVEILAQGSSYTVWVNEQEVNSATGVEFIPGPVGLQSEGGAIDFRRATITPLP